MAQSPSTASPRSAFAKHHHGANNRNTISL